MMKQLVCLICVSAMLCVAPSLGLAQVIVPQILLPDVAAPATYTFAVSSTAYGYSAAGSSSLNISTDVTTSQGNRYILVLVAYSGDNGSPTGVVRNSQSFTSHGTYTGDAWHVASYGLIAPSSGTYNTTVSFSANMTLADAIVGVWVFTGANQTAPVGSIAGGFSWGSGTSSVSVTSVSGDIVPMIAYNNGTYYSSSGSGQTHDWATCPNTGGAGDHKTATGTTTTLTINWVGSEMYVAGGIAVKPN